MMRKKKYTFAIEIYDCQAPQAFKRAYKTFTGYSYQHARHYAESYVRHLNWQQKDPDGPCYTLLNPRRKTIFDSFAPFLHWLAIIITALLLILIVGWLAELLLSR